MTSSDRRGSNPTVEIDNQSNKIVILGAGISGSIAALAFAHIGREVIIIESKSTDDQQYFMDPRSTAITDSSKKYFEEIGIWKDVAKLAGPIKDIYVVDNKSPEMIHFDSKDIKSSDAHDTASGNSSEQYMGYLVLNIELRKLLLQLIQQNNNITLKDKTVYKSITNTEAGCNIELLDGELLGCEMVLACDGKNSPARLKYFSDIIERDYKQKAMTFIVEHEKPHEGTAVEHFMTSGPFAILPLKNQHQSSIVWSLEEEKAEAVLLLPAEEFSYMVQENFGEFLGKVKVTEKPKLFPLSARLTSRYVNKRVVLVADAAHVIHPLAGQGLNQGIKDIAELSGVIAGAGRTGISKQTLEQYEKARKYDNHNMLEITDTINAIFSSNSKVLRAGRQAAFEVIEKVTPFKKLLMKYAMGSRK